MAKKPFVFTPRPRKTWTPEHFAPVNVRDTYNGNPITPDHPMAQPLEGQRLSHGRLILIRRSPRSLSGVGLSPAQHPSNYSSYVAVVLGTPSSDELANLNYQYRTAKTLKVFILCCVDGFGSRYNFPQSMCGVTHFTAIVPRNRCALINPHQRYTSTSFDLDVYAARNWSPPFSPAAWAFKALAAAFSRTARESIASKIRGWNGPESKRELAIKATSHYSYANARNIHGGNSYYRRRFIETMTAWTKRNREEGAVFGAILRPVIAAEKSGDVAAMAAAYSQAHSAYASGSKFRLLLATRAARAGLNAAFCGHFVHNTDVLHDVTVDRMGNDRQYCASCVTDNIARGVFVHGVVTRAGSEGLIDTRRVNVYREEDGQHTIFEPTPVIGQYHSSRSYFTKPMPHVTGHKAKGPFLGVELEFVRGARTSEDDNTLARRMLKRLDSVTAVVKMSTGERYCAFERDGSVDFEMVTGFGPLDIHRAAFSALLGGAPFAGQLRSHDGGRCGLHVHIDKPESLTHAKRMVRFYNASENKPLIQAIARRYDAGARYAAVIPEKCVGENETKQAWRDAKYYESANNRTLKASGTLRKRTLRAAIGRINANQRYELLNFQPAKTVEVRAFRGSMVATSVIACIEFAYMSWMFARDRPKMTTPEFLAYIQLPEWRHETRYLREYLHGKGFSVWVPRARPTPVIAPHTEDETE